MKPSDIEIYPGTPEHSYRLLGHVKAQISAGIGIYGKTPTLEDVNQQLRYKAAQVGANAVINVTYGRGISAWSWNVLNGEGDAVVIESEEKQCPYCAETIKREARICRYCGRPLVPVIPVPSTQLRKPNPLVPERVAPIPTVTAVAKSPRVTTRQSSSKPARGLGCGKSILLIVGLTCAVIFGASLIVGYFTQPIAQNSSICDSLPYLEQENPIFQDYSQAVHDIVDIQKTSKERLPLYVEQMRQDRDKMQNLTPPACGKAHHAIVVSQMTATVDGWDAFLQGNEAFSLQRWNEASALLVQFTATARELADENGKPWTPPASTALIAASQIKTSTPSFASTAPTALRTPSPLRSRTKLAGSTPMLIAESIQTPIASTGCSNPKGDITSPIMDAKLSGVVAIRGTANRTDFNYYKVQYRHDTNSDWGQLVKSQHTVVNGVLLAWDTSKVEPGEYWIRLIVADPTGNYAEPCEVHVVVEPG